MKYSIWGPVQQATEIAKGITEVMTAGHGGIIVSAERYQAMPDKFKACSFTGDRNFEEDCSWCGVVLSFPELFDAERIALAQRTFDSFYRNR